jgi:gas vesicle protein
MLLLAPQSWKKTRAQIRQKSIELRDQTGKTVEGAVAQARGKARQITDDVREQAGELQQRGQDVLDEQRGHLSKTLKDAGKAVEA